MSKKLIVNGRDFGEVTLHAYDNRENAHEFMVFDGQVCVKIPTEHIATYRNNYNHNIRLNLDGNYMYQIIREYADGEVEPLDTMYKKESDALERARLHTRAYATDFWKDSKYYKARHFVVAVKY